MAVSKVSFVTVMSALITLISAQGSISKPCNTSFVIDENYKSYKLTYHGSRTTVPPNSTCLWTMQVQGEAFLQAKDFFLTDEDSFAVYEQNGSSRNLEYGPYHGRQGPFVIVLPEGNHTLELSTTDDNYARGFLLNVENSCTGVYTFTSVAQPGVIRSPFYTKSRKGLLYCTMLITGFGVTNKPDFLALSVVSFNMSNGSLSVAEGKAGKKLVDVYDFVHVIPPPIFFSKEQFNFTLTINREVEDQFLVLEYEIVSESCSKVINLTSTNSTSLISLSIQEEIIWLPLFCRWLVNSPHNFSIHLTSPVLKLQDVQDRLTILGPVNSKFDPVLVTSTSQGLAQGNNIVLEKHVVLKYDSPHPRRGSSLQIKVSLSAGHLDEFVEQGIVTINESSSGFKLRVDEEKYIKLSWSSPVPQSALLSIYGSYDLNGDPFVELTDDTAVHTLTLPFSNLRFIAQRLQGTSWTVKFEGVSKGSCDQTKYGQQVLFESTESCGKTNCSWIVPPKPSDEILHVSFLKLDLGPSGYLDVYHLLGYDKPPVAKFTSKSTKHSLNIPVKRGLLINLHTDCSSKDSLVMASVLLKPACLMSHVVTLGESVQVESPGYPNAYPLNLECQWTVTTSAHFLALRFSQISLSSSQSHLLITSKDKKLSFSGLRVTESRVLPDDTLLEAPVTLLFKAPATNLNVPLSAGFLITAVAFDCGDILTAPSGLVKTPKNSGSCLWTISVPEAGNGRTQLNLSVPQGSWAHLKVFDGGSMRDKTIFPNKDGIVYSSGPKLIVLYKHEEHVGPTEEMVLLHYSTNYCSDSHTCGTGQCLQHDWVCNGINECGDFTDEQQCLVEHTVPSVNCPPCENISIRPSSFRTSSVTSPSSKPPTTVSKLPPMNSSSKGSNRVTVNSPTTGSYPLHSSTTSVHDHKDDEHHHRSERHSSSCISTLHLAVGVTGSLLAGLFVGGLVMSCVLKQVQKKKDWFSLQSSNSGLAADNVSL